MTLGNVCAYGFVVLAARSMIPASYGQVGALLGLLLVVDVVAVGLQANAAREAATHTGRGQTRRSLRRGLIALAALVVLGTAISPVVARVLDLDGPLPVVLTTLAAGFLAVSGSAVGILQGRERWTSFAAVQLSSGISRLVVGGGAILIWPTPTGALFGVAAGAAVPMTIAWLTVTNRVLADDREAPAPSAEPSTRSSALHDSHMLLALLVLSNCDVLLVRHVLEGHDSGLYAAGLIVTKAVLFLPQFVIAVAFPSMVRSDSAQVVLKAAGVVVGLGLLIAGGVLLLPGLALTVVGGPKYEEVAGSLWAFSLLGTVLSLINVMVFRLIAHRRYAAVAPLWVGAACLAAAVLTTSSVSQVLTVTIATDTAVLLVLGWLTLRSRATT